MDRKAKQADLIFQMGLVLKPVLDIIQDPAKYDSDERRHVRACFHVDRDKLHDDIHAFCRSDPGAEYLVEMRDIQEPLNRMNDLVLRSLVEDPSGMAAKLEGLRQDFLKALAEFPVSVDTVIYDAKTPFSAYCRIRSLCETTNTRVQYMDRYLDDTLIPRLLQGIPPSVHVTVVTWPKAKHNNTKNYDAFIDISRLYAKERPTKYRLLTNPLFHDRWLICDDQFYHLGGSVKDAADTCVFTVSRVDSTPANLQKVADLIDNGTELFGPTNPVHP